MPEIRFRPDLSSCVHTLAKREYDRLMRVLLETGDADRSGQVKLEMLRSFLETTDFVELRRRYEPHLVDGRSVIFKLCSAEGRTEYEFEVE